MEPFMIFMEVKMNVNPLYILKGSDIILLFKEENFMHREKEIKCWYCNKKFIRKNIGIKWCSDKCRLLKKIKKKKSGCWEWQSGKGTNGYGVSSINGKNMQAHRHFYLVFKGNIPKEKQINHKCDNPSCVNPDHLWVGSQKENMEDKKNKGRCADKRGEKHHLSRFVEDDVKKIREMYKYGVTQKIISKVFKCDPSNISYIVRNKRWSHI